jgi:large subunit ribosomal protein L6
MSRVAKAPITLPSSVNFSVEENVVTIKGPKGSLSQKMNHLVTVALAEDSANVITFKPSTNDPLAWAQAGTARAVVNNMVAGVTDGFSVTLELVGVGYRAQSKGTSVALSLGFSHPIEYSLPEGVTAETPNVTTIILRSIDKQRVGQVAAEIRSFRPPEPYKGKGVKYANETIVRKEAKKK